MTMPFINEIEIVVNIFLQGLGEWLILPMQAITALGYEQFFILLLPTIYWCFDQMLGLRVGIIFLLGSSLNAFFKFIFHSPRPYWVSSRVHAYSFETSFGLPSGHAQISATMWGWLAVEVKKRWFKILSLILIFLIGVSRLYLGVHFLSDVLLGWILGGLLVWAFSAWHKRIGDWISKLSTTSKLVLVAVSACALLALILGARWMVGPWEMPPEWAERAGDVDPYGLEGALTLCGTWFGMLGGYVMLTASKGYFSAREGDWKRLARFLVGLVGLLILYFGLGQIFPDKGDLISYFLRFVRYTLIGLWVSWWGPLFFERINLLRFKELS
ncbi:MAG: phosphatase PAP2 family protein [Chloroflexota bacterium]|nr:phosphatase PAP2 family protein [Chloroflexota bacterium]